MVIDDRVGSRELALIYPLSEIAMVSRLECSGCSKHSTVQAIGDVAMVGNGPDGNIAIGIEVKQMSDLISSQLTGRLGDQLRALVDHYDESWILTYGRYRAGVGGRLELWRGERWRTHPLGPSYMPYSYIEGFLLTAKQAGVTHKHVETEEQAATWLTVLENWWSKDWSEHKAFHRFNKSATPGIIPDVSPDMHQRMRIAAELPGVGWGKALAAAVTFPSVKAMINATEREWCEVPGIGPVIAKSIRRAIL